VPLATISVALAHAERDASDEPALASQLASLRGRIEEPLRVAIVGRISAGKSTLVNALVGQRVAPTDARECTKLVTWYRYGPVPLYRVVHDDGSTTEHPLPADGRLPSNVGVEPRDPVRIAVELPCPLLRELTLIDTPGLGSPDRDGGGSTHDLLSHGRSTAALPQADALIVLLGADGARDYEVAAVTEPVTALGLPAIGALSRADSGPGPDPIAASAAVARGLASDLTGIVTEVRPLAGLIAETALTGSLGDADVSVIRVLAALDAADRRRVLRTPDRFRAAEHVGTPAARRRLLGLLGITGVRMAAEAIDRGAHDADAIADALRSRSGIDELRQQLLEHFARRTDLLKAAASISAIGRLGFGRSEHRGSAVVAALVETAERVALSPHMRLLDLMRAKAQVDAGQLALPDDLRADLARLVRDAPAHIRAGASLPTDRAIREAIRQRSVRWAAYESRAAPRQAHVARLALEQYLQLFDGVDEPVPRR